MLIALEVTEDNLGLKLHSSLWSRDFWNRTPNSRLCRQKLKKIIVDKEWGAGRKLGWKLRGIGELINFSSSPSKSFWSMLSGDDDPLDLSGRKSLAVWTGPGSVGLIREHALRGLLRISLSVGEGVCYTLYMYVSEKNSKCSCSRPHNQSSPENTWNMFGIFYAFRLWGEPGRQRRRNNTKIGFPL